MDTERLFELNDNNKMSDFIEENPDKYDPRKVIGSGTSAMKDKIEEKNKMFFGL